MLQQKLDRILQNYPGVLHGYTEIEYSDFSKEYQSALVIAVPYAFPYDKKLTLQTYSEIELENSIVRAREVINHILSEIELLLQKEEIKYYIPPVAQSNETDLLAPFSFKYAAARAGIGWIGKNDVIVTRQYGPRIRLSAILIDHAFQYNEPFIRSECPPDCNVCIQACPYKALKGTTWNPDIYRSEMIDYHLCNEKRSLFIKNHGRKNACGLCMAACPIGTEKKP